MHRLLGLFFASAFAAALVSAQQAALTGPVEAFTFDLPTQSFRAVIGLPGSSSFGPALGGTFDAGSVAPHANYAVAFQQGSAVLVTNLDSGQIATLPLAGVNAQPENIRWSSDGSVAVLYSRAGNWLQVLSGLPSAPQAAPAVDLTPLGGTLSAVASDRQGKSVAFAIQGDNPGVFLLSDTQSFIPVLELARPRALAFSDDGSTLYVVDGSALQLDAVSVQDGSVQSFPLDGLQDPCAVAAGRDSQRRPLLFIASASDQILRVYDPAAQQVVTDLPLDFTPNGIVALGRNSFVIGSRSQAADPLWLLATAPQPTVYFVPAAPSSSGGLN